MARASRLWSPVPRQTSWTSCASSQWLAASTRSAPFWKSSRPMKPISGTCQRDWHKFCQEGALLNQVGALLEVQPLGPAPMRSTYYDPSKDCVSESTLVVIMPSVPWQITMRQARSAAAASSLYSKAPAVSPKVRYGQG